MALSSLQKLLSQFRLGENLFILLLILQLSYCQSETDGCAVLYTQASFEGEQFALGDRDQSINLPEDLHASATGWNVTGSIKVHRGCTLEICDDSYFDGECQPLHTGNYETTGTLNLTKITSASCTCVKECKCSDIFMKKSSCARAYLKGGCRTCHSLYTDLEGHKEFLAEEFGDKIEALRLRKGCSLTIYPEEDFGGESRIIDQEIVEDFEGPIVSYECDCNDDEFVPRVRPPRPASYPPLIDIPETLDGVIAELQKKEFADHIGLKAALKSLKAKRSSKNVYILLIGATGAGKSSAINLLFDNPNLTKVGDSNSTTTDIHEFRIPVPVDELGAANSELRVIDTPGLGDTRGLEQDAKFLATLDSYLSNHEELKDRIPNVVLLFHKFNDNRFNGEGSQFVRMLRGLETFRERITDENYSNVIFVLSHFCSETKANKRRPETRLSQFKSVIEDFSLFPKPTIITVAENKAKDQDLPMVNGYFRLPNNEYYPRNMFEKLELVTEKGGDMMGLGVFRTAFRDSDDFNVTRIDFKLVEKGFSKVDQYLRLLTESIIGVNKTEISVLLQQTWDEKVDVALRKQFPFSLQYLQKALNLRNINTREDIPKTTTAILQLLQAIKHDEATRTLLDKALNIRPPVYQKNTIAGYSYDVFKDTHLTTSPFKLGDLHQSDIGFMLPKILTCKLEPGAIENFHVFDTKSQYIQHRVQSMGIEGSIPDESFKGVTKKGHNIKEISFKEDSCTLSATREFRLFELILNDRLDLTDEFKATVRRLQPFNESSHEVVDQWKQFFNDYGTHVVKSIYGGGAIEIELSSDKPFSPELSSALFDLTKFAEDMSFLIEDQGNGTSENRTVLKEGIAHSLTFLGGDSSFHTTDLTKMTIEKASKLLTNWKKSLKFDPNILSTEMKLVPISQIVKKIGQNYTAEIERATSLLFKSEIKYVPPAKVKAGPGESRDATPFLTELFKMQQESNARIQDMMMQMKQQEMKNEERRQQMEEKRQEWERQRHQEELEYKREQESAKQLAEAERRQYLERVESRRQELENKRTQQQQEYQQQLMLAQQKASQQQMALMTQLANRPVPTPSSCLKAGTKILMADMREIEVEELTVGDLIMDKDLKPTKVIGATYELMMSQKLYGFDDKPAFFTNNHIFVGPSLDGTSTHDQLYAKSAYNLFVNNPLMEYLNVIDMGEKQTSLFKLEASGSVNSNNVTVFEDDTEYPMDTPVYYIQVDSPTGTYFANGYVCQHEIPPIEIWSNTMSILFRLMNTQAFQRLAQYEYSVDIHTILNQATSAIAEKVREYVSNQIDNDIASSFNSDSISDGIMTLADVDVDASISRIFSHPSVSYAAVSMYAKSSILLAPYLDTRMHPITDQQIGFIQHKVFDLVELELENQAIQIEQFVTNI